MHCRLISQMLGRIARFERLIEMGATGRLFTDADWHAVPDSGPWFK
ncbi:MAG: hypothetical protein AB7O38_30325 [Pirellulaceae bacterium]